MFRCENCGSGYSAQIASSWQFCPRCQAREKRKVPLTFELGWRHAAGGAPPSPAHKPPSADLSRSRSGP